MQGLFDSVTDSTRSVRHALGSPDGQEVCPDPRAATWYRILINHSSRLWVVSSADTDISAGYAGKYEVMSTSTPDDESSLVRPAGAYSHWLLRRSV